MFAAAWGPVFVPDGSLAESFARGSLVYFGVLVLFRAILKRQAGAVGLTDVMLVVLVSEAASSALTGEAKSLPNGLAAVFALLFWNYLLDYAAYRWAWFRRVVEPKELPLVVDGQMIRENLRAERISPDELLGQLRLHGIADVAKVRAAFIEPEGHISVIPVDDPPDAAALRKIADAVAELKAVIEWYEARAARRGPNDAD